MCEMQVLRTEQLEVKSGAGQPTFHRSTFSWVPSLFSEMLPVIFKSLKYKLQIHHI